MADFTAPADPSTEHLRARLAVLETRVEQALALRSGRSEEAEGDRFRGLYLRSGDVVELLAAGPAPALTLDASAAELLQKIERGVDEAEAGGETTRLRTLQRTFALDSGAVELLLLAVAPDLDPRFERFYAYLHDDISQRRISVGLALSLAGMSPFAGRDRSLLLPGSPLVRGGLVEVESADRPFLSRTLRVPDRVTGYLLGDDAPDPNLDQLLAPVLMGNPADSLVLARGIANGARLSYVQESRGASGYTMAAAALMALELPPVQLDLRRLPPGPLDPALVRAAGREALLEQGALVAGPIEQLAELGTDAVRAFTELPGCTILVGSRSWDPLWARRIPLIVRAPVPSRDDRAQHWRAAMDGSAADKLDYASVTADLRLTPAQVFDAVAAARQQAHAHDRELEAEDLRRGARAQNAAGLEQLAVRIQPSVGWSDLVLPEPVLNLVRELTARWRHRDTVLEQWRMGGSTTRRRGIIALFAGPPGTGKTMAAEVIAGEFGLDLYVVNVATVVDKYIGETEKNLERVFREAEEVNGILFFDEADAIFGKRSEVKDARDRYANIEIAYLLQRMELLDGIAILATNLKTNVDEAFARRLDVSIDFPKPDVAARRTLWDHCIGERIPLYDDIDLDFLARSFDLSGGSIRNIAVTAAYLAAERDGTLAMEDLIRATGREYRKLGRLCLEAEFGPWMEVLGAP